jgi:hypothetical protein
VINHVQRPCPRSGDREHDGDPFGDARVAARGEYGTASDPHLVAQAPEFADALASEMREQCQVSEQGSFVLGGSVDDTQVGPTPSHWSKVCPERTAGWDIVMLLHASVMWTFGGVRPAREKPMPDIVLLISGGTGAGPSR